MPGVTQTPKGVSKSISSSLVANVRIVTARKASRASERSASLKFGSRTTHSLCAFLQRLLASKKTCYEGRIAGIAQSCG